MSDFLEVIILGAVQGVTEFLPVSSSGHLLLGQYFFGMSEDEFGLTFDVALHLGSLLAVLSYFWRDVLGMAGAFLRSLPRPDFSDTEQRMAYLLIVATIPAASIGFAFRGFFETGLRSPWVVVAGLTVFGMLFIVSERVGEKRKRADKMSFRDSLWIGIGQAISLLPGVSRSGATITFGLFAGLDRREAARFSFLMSIPITAGAVAAQIPVAFGEAFTARLGLLFFIGFVVSGVVAYLSIKFLLAFFAKYSMRVFAYYGFALSAVVATFLLLGF
ncbi:MAG: undecaprenyl-diphosphatase UppP [Rubrobacter sp.]|nr:undecaprenyl-diphosphatase UppP [Rubrobacter sp.]